MTTTYLDIDTKVRNIISSCRSVDALHPVVSELCQHPEFKRIFWDSLHQDLHVICQRSQILGHGEITIIQKAFAVLMEKKEDIVSAIDLYVNEILGLKFVSETDRAKTLNTMIQTRHSVLRQGCGSKPSDSASISNDGDERLKRLFIVYHKARKDFDTTPAKTLERTKSAKFLRDTTENCLAYMAAKQTQSGGFHCDGKMLEELRATLEETIVIAEQGSGGKKRRFDEDWGSVPKGPANKMRDRSMAQPLGNADPVPRGRTSQKKRRATASQTKEDYPRRCLNTTEHRRSVIAHKLYPTSVGQSVRGVLGDGHSPDVEKHLSSCHVYGDRYRPTYKK